MTSIANPVEAALSDAPVMSTPWPLILGLWTVAGAYIGVAGLIEGFEPAPVALTRALVMAAAGGMLDLALWQASRVWPRAALRTAFLATGAVAVVAAHVAIERLCGPLLYALFGAVPDVAHVIADNKLRAMLMELIVNTNLLLFLAIHALFFVTSVALQWMVQEREQDRRVAEARAHAVSAQLATLRQQLSPHFMFNTLNAIGSLVATGRGEQAEEMIERLSAFLRAGLGRDTDPFVTLDEELALTQTYLDIEAVRFGDRLSAHFALSPGLRRVLVPSFLLQPLVENAIKYGVAPAMRPVALRISAERSGDRLMLAVEDDGPGSPRSTATAGTGTGLRNIRERLALLFGSEASLDAAPSGEGFAARIHMPLRMAEEDSGE